jgi:iron complex outermembrane receptor protein
MRKLTFVLFLLTASIISSAQGEQRRKISVTVRNEQQAPLESATIELLQSKDSVLVKTALSDKSGFAEIEQVLPGSYRLKITMVSHEDLYSAPFSLGDTDLVLQPVVLYPKVQGQLQGVTVTGRKPFIQRMADRIVVNVENSVISAGASALDVLERSPGVTIDQNDALSLRGRAGVIIMIDGKPSPLGAADLANYLRGLPSSAIESIHIITNPSAKYDAAGNSGIIDIRMKKDQRLGTNGTVTVSGGQGIYPKANASLGLNYRNKKANVFGNYNYAYREGLNHLVMNRSFYENGAFNGADEKDNYNNINFNTHAVRAGADFFPSDKTIVGFVVSSNRNNIERKNRNNSEVMNAQSQPTFTFNTTARGADKFRNTFANVNFKHSFNTKGRELTADVDYGVFSSDVISSTATRYFKLDGSMQQPTYILDGDQDGKLTLKTAKVDYSHPLTKGKMELGFKTSFVSSDNDAKFFDMSTGVPQNDVNKTNHFFYEENTNALYANYGREFNKFEMQLGLRSEQTTVNTNQVVGNIKWDSSYIQLFPSAYFTYKIKEDQSLGLSVSRRIDRPSYQQLNPFLFLIDVTTYNTGNPRLLPQLTWSYEVNYMLKNLNFTLGFSRTKDIHNMVIVRFKDAFPSIPADDNVTVLMPVNLESSDYIGLSVSAPIRVTKWWSMVNNGDLYYLHFNGNLSNTTLDKGAPAVDLRSNNSFTFPGGWTAELNGNYSSGGRYGFMRSKPSWGLSTGVQKTIFQGKGTMRFNVTDIFWTNLPRATITYEGVYVEKWHAFRETRVATLSFTYRFGNSKVQAARKRATASEEERRRAGGN